VSDGQSDADSTQPDHSRRDRAITIAVLGLILAAIPIAWAIYTAVRDDFEKEAYIKKADQACEGHRSDLNALGPEPWKSESEVFALWTKKRMVIARAALKDWGEVLIPPEMESDVKDLHSLSGSAVRAGEMSADYGALGLEDQANVYIDQHNGYATEAIRKARSIGLEVCPLGI
jgi:hypothetical protein